MDYFYIFMVVSGWVAFGITLIKLLSYQIKTAEKIEQLEGDIVVFKHVLKRSKIEITKGVDGK